MATLYYAALSIGIFTVVVLVISAFTKNKNNIWLAASSFSLWFIVFITHISQTGEVLKYPHLIRTGNFFAYLIYPFLFIYAYNSFYPPGKWKKWHGLLFIPALIYLIDLFPFFVLPGEDKVAIMEPLLQDREQRIRIDQGWIAIPYLHAVLRYVWSGIVFLLLIQLLRRNYYLQHSKDRVTNRVLFRMITLLTAAYFPLLLIAAIEAITQQKSHGFTIPLIIMSVSLIGLAFCIQLFPGILYGLQPLKIVSSNTSQIIIEEKEHDDDVLAPQKINFDNSINSSPRAVKSSGREIDQGTIEEALEKIGNFLENSVAFSKLSYSIHDLAFDSEVPAYLVSIAINQHLGQNFSQFINGYRIKLFEKLCAEPQNAQLTLEALAQQSGFKSRSTFINAFKKVHGITPSEYLKLQQKAS